MIDAGSLSGPALCLFHRVSIELQRQTWHGSRVDITDGFLQMQENRDWTARQRCSKRFGTNSLKIELKRLQAFIPTHNSDETWRQLVKRPCMTYTCAVVLPSDITSRSEWHCNHEGSLPPALSVLAAATDLLAPSLSQSAPLAAPTDSSRLVPELLL